MSRSPPEDLSGVPIPSDKDETGVVIQCIIGAIRRLNKLKKGVLHLDEIGNASRTVQGAALSLLQERRCGDTDLAPEIRILLSTNPPRQTSTGSNILPAFANRTGHWLIGPDFESWCVFVENEGLETLVEKSSEDLIQMVRAGWVKHYTDIRALKLRFMKANRGLFYDQPNTHDKKSGNAWGSPRTWDMAHRCVATARCLGAPKELEAIMIAGWVGEGPSIDWVTFEANDDLPSGDRVLRDWTTPQAWPIDNDRQDRTFSVVRSVRMYVLGTKDDAERIELAKRAWGWMGDVEKEGHIDMVQPVAKEFANRGLGRGVNAELDKACEPLLKRFGQTGAVKYAAGS